MQCFRETNTFLAESEARETKIGMSNIYFECFLEERIEEIGAKQFQRYAMRSRNQQVWAESEAREIKIGIQNIIVNDWRKIISK